MRGFGDYHDRSGHIVVLGWQDDSTVHTLRLLEAEREAGEPLAILVAKNLAENPAPDCVDFVYTERLSDPEALARAGAANARAIIVSGANDDETLAAALLTETQAPEAHIVAYFSDEKTAETIRLRNPRIEAFGSLSEELITRAARDPGSSVVASRLLSAASADTSFSITVPKLPEPLRYIDVFLAMKRLHQVTVVGMACNGDTDLNCADDQKLAGGEKLYYIANRRLAPASVDWAKMTGAA